jgi:hypothetical protein
MPLSHVHRILVACGMLLAGCASPGARDGDIRGGDTPYSFAHAPYIHPRIIQDLSSWLSDGGDQVVAINLPDAQNSNRYFGEVRVREIPGKHPFVYVEGDKKEFGYQYVGRSDGGVHVLFTSDWEGGSGVFRHLLFVVFEHDWGTLSHPDRSLIDLGRDRLLIVKLGEISLGDRYGGKLEVAGNRLLIGRDVGWFSVSGGTGGCGRTRDELLRLDFTRPQGSPSKDGQFYREDRSEDRKLRGGLTPPRVLW